MPNRHLSTLLMLAALPMSAEPDALHFDGPKYLDKSTCHIFSKGVGREACFSPEGDPPGGGGGGGDKKHTDEDVNRIVQERLAKDRQKTAGELEQLRAQLAELGDLKKKVEEADARETKAREEAELKGKTELEQLQIKLNKTVKEFDAYKGEAGKLLEAEKANTLGATNKHLDYVRRHHVTTALTEAGLATGALRAASRDFLADAKIELTEDGAEVKGVSLGGRTFDKAVDAAKQYLTDNPYLKSPPPGGAGTPKPNGAGGGDNGLAAHNSATSLISAGLAAREASS